MTYEKVLKVIEEYGLNISSTIHEECMEKIKESLEKQMPKKTNIHGYRTGREVNTISYTCPVCNKHISNEGKYCKHCGQALDFVN